MLKTVHLVLVLDLQLQWLEFPLEVTEGHDLSWVVGGERGALESLPQDLVAGPDALGVECRREEFAPSLAWSVSAA
jgi:hypothetical protein